MIKDIGVAGKAARAAHHRDPFPLAGLGVHFRRRVGWIKLDVVAYEEIEASVAVIIEEGATRAPANTIIVKAGLASDVGKGAVAVVVEQNVVSPEAAKKIVPAIVVVVADADSRLPAGAGEPGSFCDVSEGPIAVVLVEMRSGLLSGRPVLAQSCSVGQINIQPAITVVIKKSDPAAFGFDNVAFMIDGSPDVRDVEPGFVSYVHVLHWRYGSGGRGGLKHKTVLPFPERRGERIDERTAQHY